MIILIMLSQRGASFFDSSLQTTWMWLMQKMQSAKERVQKSNLDATRFYAISICHVANNKAIKSEIEQAAPLRLSV